MLKKVLAVLFILILRLGNDPQAHSYGEGGTQVSRLVKPSFSIPIFTTALTRRLPRRSGVMAMAW